jgi:hypothetical protein
MTALLMIFEVLLDNTVSTQAYLLETGKRLAVKNSDELMLWKFLVSTIKNGQQGRGRSQSLTKRRPIFLKAERRHEHMSSEPSSLETATMSFCNMACNECQLILVGTVFPTHIYDKILIISTRSLKLEICT